MNALPSAYVIGPVSAWFALNVAIGNLNGWVLRDGFDYPVLLTIVHMVLCWVLSAVALMTFMRRPHAKPTPRNASTSYCIRSAVACMASSAKVSDSSKPKSSSPYPGSSSLSGS